MFSLSADLTGEEEEGRFLGLLFFTKEASCRSTVLYFNPCREHDQATCTSCITLSPIHAAVAADVQFKCRSHR
jgi:hypothetical protein